MTLRGLWWTWWVVIAALYGGLLAHLWRPELGAWWEIKLRPRWRRLLEWWGQ
jgi:hypothetical protein